ncbi:unnamed protein product [Merluccius merluccius]
MCAFAQRHEGDRSTAAPIQYAICENQQHDNNEGNAIDTGDRSGDWPMVRGDKSNDGMASPKCHWVYYFILIWLLILTAGEVLFFFFYTAGELNRWRATSEEPSLISTVGVVLTLKQDAYYFLCLQVTFTTAAAGVKVTVVRNKKVILEGTVQQSNLSTGLLGKVEVMSAGDILVVNVTQSVDINKTNLGIIYLPKQTGT